MTKAEILKDENIPQFIKEIIANAPEDADIEICAVKSDRKPTAKEDGRKCDSCNKKNEGGISVGPYIESLFTQLKELADMADCEGNLNEKDVELAISLVSLLDSSLDCLDEYLTSERNRREKKTC